MILASRNASDRKIKRLAILVVIYLIFVLVCLPLLSPLRNLGVMEPGYIRNAILPFLFLAIFFTAGIGNLLKPRSGIQILFILMIFQSSLLGIWRLFDFGGRAYFSHIFQISSAYLLIYVGWIMFDYWGEVFWRRMAFISLVAAFFSSALVIGALDRGDIGRYYTAAYGFIFVSAFSAVASKKMQLMSFIGAGISNKRAVVLAIVSIAFAGFLNRKNDSDFTYTRLLAQIAGMFVVVAGGVFCLFLAIGWAKSNEDAALAKAINISVARAEQVIQIRERNKSLDEISSGRFAEIDAAVDSLDGFDFVFGSGAGWTIKIDYEREVQNIHFTPLSLVAVYGIPYVVIFYGFLIAYLIRFFVKRRKRSFTEQIAPLYIIGGLVHSFFAYSLFIDWMFFFFVGVLIRSVTVRNVNRLEGAR
ncbi:hypothetical protein [Alloalcanivorax xenomutans]|nr:hypothetical protein [Candidatus Neomarinimicrobiota bacterium]